MISKLDEILKILKNSKGSSASTAPPEEFSVSADFPIEGIEELIRMDEKLKNDKGYKKEVVSNTDYTDYLSSLMGIR